MYINGKMVNSLLFRCVNGTALRNDEGVWVCSCDPCYGGANCDVFCSGIGTECVANDTCFCGYDGWTGDLCQLRGCPGYPTGITLTWLIYFYTVLYVCIVQN